MVHIWTISQTPENNPCQFVARRFRNFYLTDETFVHKDLEVVRKWVLDSIQGVQGGAGEPGYIPCGSHPSVVESWLLGSKAPWYLELADWARGVFFSRKRRWGVGSPV